MLENLKEFTNRLQPTNPQIPKPKQIRTKLFKKTQVPKIADQEIPTHKTFGAAVWHREDKSKEIYQPRTWDSLAHSKESKQEEQRNRSLFSRPEQLLKKYLHRKQKLSGLPVFDPEYSEQPTQPQYKTLTDFRIKKPKKGMSVMPLPVNQLQSDYSVQYEPAKYDQVEQNFMQFNTTKNLYKMTYEQLQASIHWKKQFLDVLNKKIRESRTSQMRNRLY